MTLGEQIRAGREAKRMTLRALAKALDVSAPYMVDVEHDRRGLSDEKLALVAKVLEIDPVLLDAARGYTRDLADWLKDNPDLIKLLREMKQRERVVIGGPDCPCCGQRRRDHG